MIPQDIQQLQEVIEQQALMMDTIPIQMWFLSDIETYGRVNQSHASFMGLQKQDMEFKKLQEFLPADVANVCKQSNQAVFLSKKAVISEEWIPDANGIRRLIQITKTPRFNKAGNIEYIVCFGIDITDYRTAELSMAQSEENFRTFIETINDIVLIGNLDGQIIYSNPAATTKLGYSPAELKTMRLLDLHPTWVQKEAEIILTEMFNGKRSFCPLPLISKNQHIIPVETRVWFGKWNGTTCIFGISKDLSKEQEALQKFDRLFRMNPALMAVTRLPDRVFVDVNHAFLHALGYSANEIIGKTSAEVGIFLDIEQQEQIAQLLLSKGKLPEIELHIKTKDGRMLAGLFSGDIIESQGIQYFLTVMVDITRRKQAEAEREKTIQELNKALAEIKTLRGIVPICAGCKKVRGDRGYWEQVEAYVARHTEAQFSHGMCPSCMQKYYPDLCKDRKSDTMNADK